MKNSKRKTGLLIIISIIGLIVIIRLLLPIVMLDFVNQKIDENPDYDGKVEDVDLSILAGHYAIRNIKIFEVDSKIEAPLLEVENIWFAIDYGSLLRGNVVGEIDITKPVINFVKGPTEEETQDDVDDNLAETLSELMPVRIDRLAIHDGKVRYMDFTSDPNIDVQAYNINITSTDLSTEPSNNILLPATVKGFANTTGEGRVDLHMKLNPVQEVPTFDINFELTDLQLKSLNDFIQAYGNFDVQGGTFGLHTEIAARDGYFKGYVKPLIHNLEIAPLEKEDKGLLQKLWESAVSIASGILENPQKDQLGTQIPLEGKFKNPNVRVWRAIGFLLRNAFIEALVPSIDQSINIRQVKEVIEEEKGKK